MIEFKETKIKLSTINDVKDFCNLASKNRGNVILMSDRFSVDGKSIMGIMSLDLSKPVSLTVDYPISDEFADGVKKYVSAE